LVHGRERRLLGSDEPRGLSCGRDRRRHARSSHRGAHASACIDGARRSLVRRVRLAGGLPLVLRLEARVRIFGGIAMILAAPTILPHVRHSRHGVVGGAIFMGVGLGIVASGTLVPMLVRIGLVQAWLGLGALATLSTASGWSGWPQDDVRGGATGVKRMRSLTRSSTRWPLSTLGPSSARELKSEATIRDTWSGVDGGGLSPLVRERATCREGSAVRVLRWPFARRGRSRPDGFIPPVLPALGLACLQRRLVHAAISPVDRFLCLDARTGPGTSMLSRLAGSKRSIRAGRPHPCHGILTCMV